MLYEGANINEINKLYNDVYIYEEKLYGVREDIRRYINVNYRTDCGYISKHCLTNDLNYWLNYYTPKKQGYERAISKANEWLNSQYIYFIFNIYRHRKAICEDLVNKFGLIKDTDRDYRATFYRFKLKRENFDAFCGLCKLIV